MLKLLRILIFVLSIAIVSFLTKIAIKQKDMFIPDFLIHKSLIFFSSRGKNAISYNISQTLNYKYVFERDVLKQGKNILFMETTDRMDEPSLVLCSVESAARMYPDRPVVFFLKGLGDIVTEDDEKKAQKHYPSLSFCNNIYIFPLKLKELFADTPFQDWFKKIDPKKEIYWTNNKSNAGRLAVMWKYGGIYMDTDVISIQPVLEDNFLAAENSQVTSSSVFGLSPHHKLTWELMENFVQHYRGNAWGHQGPGLFTRVVKKHCVPKFTSVDHVKCENVSYFHAERFYPIYYPSWRRYFEVWKNLPSFKDSYALHLWNYMNKERISMVVGSNTLVEHLYKQYCPSTYKEVLKKLSPREGETAI